MDFPPSEWDVFPVEDYSLAVPRDPGELGAELAVQVRANGRIQDHYRLSLGGSKVVERIFPSLIKRAGAPAWMIKYGVWPRDIVIRQNMTTSAWEDVSELVSAGSAQVLLGDDQVDAASFNEAMEAGTSQARSKVSASIRWAIAVGDDAKIHLQLQGLPAPAGIINGKPGLRG